MTGAVTGQGREKDGKRSPARAPTRSSTRRSTADHQATLYSSVGANGKSGQAVAQRHCVVCGKKFSFFCSKCGQDCPIHPTVMGSQGAAHGVAHQHSCLTEHARDPLPLLPGCRLGAEAPDGLARPPQAQAATSVPASGST